MSTAPRLAPSQSALQHPHVATSAIFTTHRYSWYLRQIPTHVLPLADWHWNTVATGARAETATRRAHCPTATHSIK